MLEFIKFVILCGSCVILSTLFSLPKYTAALAARSQNLCRVVFHRELPNSPIVEAYLCGIDLPVGFAREVFTKTSLYHLIVVSASHLIFLGLFLKALQLERPVQFTILALLLCVLTGFQPPLVRALFERAATAFSKLFRLHWRGHQNFIFGSFLALSFFPHWIGSLSFQLSFGACIGLWLCRHLPLRGEWRGHVLIGICIYLLLAPLLLGWGQLHPLSIASNIVLAPLVSLLLWVICGLWIVAPLAASRCFDLLLQGLNILGDGMPMTQWGTTLLPQLRWIYLLLLMAILWALQKQAARPQ